jgi:hypothetical protein
VTLVPVHTGILLLHFKLLLKVRRPWNSFFTKHGTPMDCCFSQIALWKLKLGVLVYYKRRHHYHLIECSRYNITENCSNNNHSLTLCYCFKWVKLFHRHEGRVMVFNATFNNIFSYIVVVSFIGGGNRSTWRKPPTCHKSLTNRHEELSL